MDVPNVDVSSAFIRMALGDRWLEAPNITRITCRDEFDAAVAAHLPARGIELREGVRVKDIHRKGDQFEIETTGAPVRARAIVGADGVASPVRRCLFDAPASTFLMAIADCAAPGHFTHTKKAIELDFRLAAKRVPGYRWIFPFLKDGEEWVNVGICEWRHRSAKELKEDLSLHMQSLELDHQNARFRFFPERPFSPRNPFCAPGVILAGEAAGIDPFFGEGISYGIEYGMLTALTLANALSRNDYSFSDHMSSLKWSRVGKELMVTWAASWLFYSRLHMLFARAGMSDDYMIYLLGEVLSGRLRPSKKLAAKMALRVVKNLFKW